MKLLFLTLISNKPTKAGEEKIKNAIEVNKREKEDGLPLSWYKEQNILPPKGLEEDLKKGLVILTEKEMELDYKDCTLRLSEFSNCVDNTKVGCVITTKNGDKLWVEQDSSEVYDYITVLTRHWTTVLADNIIYYFNFFSPKKQYNNIKYLTKN